MSGLGVFRTEVVEKVDLEGLDPALEPDGEKFHRVARIVLGAIPVAGNPLLEVFNSVVESPLNRRKTDTIIQIGELLNDLIEKGVVTEEGLKNNEAFISTVADVCNISIRNHQAEKLEALKNAIKNSALPMCPADDYRQLFLNFVDICTVTHIRLLRLFSAPLDWIVTHSLERPGAPGQDCALAMVVWVAFPDIHGNQDLANAVWMDLYQRGLVKLERLDTPVGYDQLLGCQTTYLGSSLVRFIS